MTDEQSDPATCEHDWGTQDFTDLGVPEEDHVWDCWKCGATRSFAELFPEEVNHAERLTHADR